MMKHFQNITCLYIQKRFKCIIKEETEVDESIILAEKLKKHDEEAFDRIIEIYTPMVWAIVKNISGSSLTREDTEETVSDVFVTLWKNAGNFDPEKLSDKEADKILQKTRILAKQICEECYMNYLNKYNEWLAAQDPATIEQHFQ